jgi:hypothetical protein
VNGSGGVEGVGQVAHAALVPMGVGAEPLVHALHPRDMTGRAVPPGEPKPVKGSVDANIDAVGRTEPFGQRAAGR